MKHSMIFLAIALSAGSANAVLLDITDIEGSWTNADPGPATIVNASAQATDTVRWGVSAGSGQSGYNFTTANDLLSIPTGTSFLLGSFEHVNNPITPPSLESIDYSLGFNTNGNPLSLSTLLTFTHNETTNREPCPVAGTSTCDDVVTIFAGAINQPIVVGDMSYLFELLGFSTDSGSTFSTEFQSEENGTNGAGLYATITAQPVPEPGTLALLGLGLAGLGFSRRRKA